MSFFKNDISSRCRFWDWVSSSYSLNICCCCWHTCSSFCLLKFCRGSIDVGVSGLHVANFFRVVLGCFFWFWMGVWVDVVRRGGESDKWLWETIGGSLCWWLDASPGDDDIMRLDGEDDDGGCHKVRHRYRLGRTVEGLLSFKDLSLGLSNFSRSKQPHPEQVVIILVEQVAPSWTVRTCRQVKRLVGTDLLLSICLAATVDIRPFLLIRLWTKGVKSSATGEGVATLGAMFL